METQQPSEGEILRDRGMQRAVDHADEAHANWSGRAFDFLREYAKHNDRFLAEDVRAASEGVVPPPPDLRAWGTIIRRAADAAIIRRIGYRSVRNRRAHCATASLWTSR